MQLLKICSVFPPVDTIIICGIYRHRRQYVPWTLTYIYRRRQQNTPQHGLVSHIVTVLSGERKLHPETLQRVLSLLHPLMWGPIEMWRRSRVGKICQNVLDGMRRRGGGGVQGGLEREHLSKAKSFVPVFIFFLFFFFFSLSLSLSTLHPTINPSTACPHDSTIWSLRREEYEWSRLFVLNVHRDHVGSITV